VHNIHFNVIDHVISFYVQCILLHTTGCVLYEENVFLGTNILSTNPAEKGSEVSDGYTLDIGLVLLLNHLSDGKLTEVVIDLEFDEKEHYRYPPLSECCRSKNVCRLSRRRYWAGHDKSKYNEPPHLVLRIGTSRSDEFPESLPQRVDRVLEYLKDILEGRVIIHPGLSISH